MVKPRMSKDDAVIQLRAELKPGDTVYTILRHRSRSGMLRYVSPILENHDWTYQVAAATGRAVSDRVEGVRCDGAGMDMGFDLVYSPGRALFPDGFECVGEGCPSNDHSNGDRDYTPGHVVHRDGGYALRQRWL